MEDKLKYWVWLAQAAGQGSKTVWNVLDHFDNDPEKVYNAEEDEIFASAKLRRNSLSAYCRKSLDDAEAIVEWCADNHTEIITPDSDQYPARLMDIINPPVVLYAAGKPLRLNDFLCVACVGTRDATDYGVNMAYTVSYDLSKAGAVIVSGLATGIDSTCHRAAIDAGADTVAVLGCGINVCYPPRNRSLMREIARNGTVLTEYPPDTKPIGKHFPLRNRIICGMCQCTVVFEADDNSGSLITADLARKQGRSLYAVPGNAGELNSIGTNKLIKAGATMVTDAIDIICDYEFLFPNRVHSDILIPFEIEKPKKFLPFSLKKKRKEKDVQDDADPDVTEKPKEAKPDTNDTDDQIINTLSADEKTVLSSLSRVKAITAEQLFSIGLPIPTVLSALTTLEILGLAEALPGGAYIRKI
ncbi:MAG: DNA-processing protein DprA [Clostridia bacterium]|nr:DNA-processing protein DprA [Clostridia bacterium]